MKRISLLMLLAVLVVTVCLPCLGASRNLVNTAPAIGGANGTFSCYQLANTTYIAAALSITASGTVTTGFINPPAPAKLTLDPTTAPGGTDVLTIKVYGTDYAGAAASDTWSWTGSDATAHDGASATWFKTITSFVTTNTGSTYPTTVAVGFKPITQFRVPPNTQWVDMQWIGTTATLYVGFTSTAITLPLCSYVFPLLASTGPVTRQMGLSGGTYLYFGVSTTANAADQLKIQCWR